MKPSPEQIEALLSLVAHFAPRCSTCGKVATHVCGRTRMDGKQDPFRIYTCVDHRGTNEALYQEVTGKVRGSKFFCDLLPMSLALQEVSALIAPEDRGFTQG